MIVGLGGSFNLVGATAGGFCVHYHLYLPACFFNDLILSTIKTRWREMFVSGQLAWHTRIDVSALLLLNIPKSLCDIICEFYFLLPLL